MADCAGPPSLRPWCRRLGCFAKVRVGYGSTAPTGDVGTMRRWRWRCRSLGGVSMPHPTCCASVRDAPSAAISARRCKLRVGPEATWDGRLSRLPEIADQLVQLGQGSVDLCKRFASRIDPARTNIDACLTGTRREDGSLLNQAITFLPTPINVGRTHSAGN